MIPELIHDFNVSIASLGALSACYFYAYAIAQIPVGMLIDRYGTRSLLTGACALIATSSLVFSQTDSMLIAELCRIFIGFGSAFAFVGCLKLGTDWFPSRQFGVIVGLTNLLGVTGAILGGKPTAYLVDQTGWRGVILLSAFVGFILTVILWSVVREHTAKPKTEPLKSQTKHAIRTFSMALKCRQTWLVAIFGGLMVAPITTYSELWGVTYLIENYNFDRPTAAQITSLTFLGIAIGGPSIGWVSDYIRKRKLPMLIGMCGAALTLAILLFIPQLPTWQLYALHFIFGFFTSSMEWHGEVGNKAIDY
jgi:MFS family permease